MVLALQLGPRSLATVSGFDTETNLPGIEPLPAKGVDPAETSMMQSFGSGNVVDNMLL